MLRSIKSVRGSKVQGKDGGLGTVNDYLFDDENWMVRYLVIDTGKWQPGRKVVIPPLAFNPLQPGDSVFSAPFTKQQIQNSPPLAQRAPISRQYEEVLFSYFFWKPYWSMPTGGLGPVHDPMKPPDSAQSEAAERSDSHEQPSRDPHLRSCDEVIGCHVKAADGDIGHVEDFKLDADDWILRYFVVDTRGWLPGRKVLLATSWTEAIRWSDREVRVDLTKDQIKNSPPFDSGAPVNRTYEAALYDYYSRRSYWTEFVSDIRASTSSN
jgi:hypothetical protein